MKSIRNSVFETNSSSSHSITIKKDKKEDLLKYTKLSGVKDGVLRIDFGCTKDFGSSYIKYRDVSSKLNYIAAIIAHFACTRVSFDRYNTFRDPIVHNAKELAELPEMQNLLKLVQKYYPEVQRFSFRIRGIFDKTSEGYLFMFYNSIDHQMLELIEYKGGLENWLKDEKLTVEKFIFNPNVILYTTGD